MLLPLLLCALLLAASSAAPAPIGLGINLGNTLDAPHEGDWAPAAQESFIAAFAAAGFATMRLPVTWDKHTSQSPPYAIDAAFLARVQTVANWSVARGLQTIVNSHHDEWLDVADDALFQARLPRFQAIWEQVAAAFAGWPPLLAFETYNEAHNMSTRSLNAMQAAVSAAVRPAHPTRTLIVGGGAWMGIRWLLQHGRGSAEPLLLPPLPDGSEDANLAVEVHNYDPFHFTTPPIDNSTWGSPSDQATLAGLFASAVAWAAAMRPAGTPPLPIFLGEFGCSVLQPNAANRSAWYSSYAQQAKASGMSGAVIWDDDGCAWWW
jgi:endoglucanase